MTLITEEEGAMEEAPSGLHEVSRIINDGPEIRMVSPQTTAENTSPLEISIVFVPKEGSDVDLSTLKVEYLKLFTIDLTKRVLEYTTREGIRIEEAELPSGKHKLRVTIGNTKGGMTREVFVVTLK